METEDAVIEVRRDSVAIRDEHVVTRVVSGETVLVPVRSRVGDLDHIYTLGDVATFVWNRIDGSRDLDDLIAATLEEFDASETVVESDLKEFIGDLRKEGLITLRGETR